jgi:hypothetical protein
MKYSLLLGLGVIGVLWSVSSILKRTRNEQVRRDELLPKPGEGTLEGVRQLANAGEKIAAIKLYRQIQGVGLKEAKDAVEKMVNGSDCSAR